eukprot:2669005-Rhodomonas_salina.1
MPDICVPSRPTGYGLPLRSLSPYAICPASLPPYLPPTALPPHVFPPYAAFPSIYRCYAPNVPMNLLCSV